MRRYRLCRCGGDLKVTVLSGGVGGARFLRGVMAVVEADNVTIIGNVGDDIEVLGLHVSPDIDSVLYALGGVADEERGWGRADESWNALSTVAALGGETWFQLGDRDIGLHLLRSELLQQGVALSAVTKRLAEGFGLRSALLPATDDPLRTFVETPAGRFRSRSGSSPEGIAMRSTPSTSRERRRLDPLLECSRRSKRPT